MEMSEYVIIFNQLLGGMKSTLLIFLSTLIFAMPLGLVVAFGRMSKFAPLRWLMRIYISIVRGTPLMLQLLVVYFAPFYLFGIKLTTQYRLTAVLIGFAFNYAAYFAEIYRAGIESIPVGQYEACTVLGYSRFQTFTKIVLPQMIKRILPPTTNEIITLVKDTAMAYVLSYAEMFTLAKQISATKTSIVPLFMAGLFYFVFNAFVAYIMEKVEESMNYYR